MPRVACVDLGSNTILLTIADLVGRELVPVVDECRFGRLGQGLAQSGSLAPEAVGRSLDILRDYRALLDQHPADELAAVGTQALRVAHNAEPFTRQAEAVLGCDVEIIAGEREAELVNRAVVHSFPELSRGEYLAVDVGGGSTELIDSRDGRVASVVSVPIGAVVLTERYLAGDPPATDEVEALVADIDAALDTLSLPRNVPIIGTAGTATTLATMSLGLEHYQPDAVQGFRIATDDLDSRLQQLLSTPLAARRGIAGLAVQRADVIAAGVAIYSRVCHRVGTEALIVSDRGVRWGLLAELADRVTRRVDCA